MANQFFNKSERKVKQAIKIPCFIVEGFTEKNYFLLLRKYFSKECHIYNCEGGGAYKGDCHSYTATFFTTRNKVI